MTFKKFKGALKLTVVGVPCQACSAWTGSCHLAWGVTGVHTIQDDRIEELIWEFVDVFDRSLAKYMGTLISFNLDPQIAPIRMKPCKMLFALLSKIRQPTR